MSLKSPTFCSLGPQDAWNIASQGNLQKKKVLRLSLPSDPLSSALRAQLLPFQYMLFSKLICTPQHLPLFLSHTSSVFQFPAPRSPSSFLVQDQPEASLGSLTCFSLSR